jgi:hypothetical protein
LNELIEQFLIQEALKKDKALQQQLLAKVYNEKNQFERFETANKAAQKELEGQKDGAFKFSQIAELKQQIFFHPHNKSLEKDANSLFEIIQYLDESHLMAKLKLVSEYLSRASIYENPKDIFLLEELIIFAQLPDFQPNKIIQFYALLSLMYLNKTPESYHLAQNFIEKNKAALYEKDYQMHLQNFLIRESNNGNENVASVILEKQKEILEKQLLDGVSVLSEQTFLNIVSAACLANDLDYLDTFIPKHESFIPEMNRKIIIILANANLSFYRYLKEKDKKHLDDILESTRDMDALKGDLTYNLMLRMNISKTYFEYFLLNNEQVHLVKSYLNSFVAFIKRKELAKERKIIYINFCESVRQILLILDDHLLKSEGKREKLTLISAKIKDLNVINKKWLMDKTLLY